MGGILQKTGPAQLGGYSSLQNLVFALNFSFLIIAMVAVGLRFWSRKIKGLRMSLNDYVALLALIVLCGFSALVSYGLCTGMGRSIEDLKNPAVQISNLLKLMVPLPILWNTINTLVKISIVDLYLRVFPGNRLKWSSYFLLSLVCTDWMISILFAFLNCRPFSFTWTRNGDGSCVDSQGGTLGFGIVNLILDAAVILLPIPYLYTLQLKLSKRLSLIFIFALGFVITAISAIRLKTIVSSTNKSFTRGSAEIALWSFLETSLSIINCCLPTMAPAFLTIGRTITEFFHPTEADESGAAPHKFVSLSATTGPYSTPPDSRSASPWQAQQQDSNMSAIARQQIPLEERQSEKQGRWKNVYYEERKEVDADSVSFSSAHRSKNSPPVPAGLRDINVQREWTVEHGYRGSDNNV